MKTLVFTLVANLTVQLATAQLVKPESKMQPSAKPAKTELQKLNLHLAKVAKPQLLQNTNLQKLKNSLSVKTEKLDSFVYEEYDVMEDSWSKSEKNSFTYNENQLMESETDFEWDAYFESWKPYHLEELTYNDGQLVNSRSFANYNLTNNDWAYMQRNTYMYDANNRVIDEQTFGFDDFADQWIPYYRTTYEYNETDQLLNTNVFYYSYYETGKWGLMSKIANTYDSIGNQLLSENLYYNSELDTFNISSKTIFTNILEGNQLKITQLQYSYNSNDSIFTLDSKLETLLDSLGQLLSIAEYYWSSYDTIWWGGSKQTYAYNENGNTIAFGDYQFQNEDWYLTDSMNYEFDANYNFLGMTIFGQNFSADFQAYYRTKIEYDFNISIDQLAIPETVLESNLINYKFIQINSEYANGENSWMPASRTNVYYSGFNISTKVSTTTTSEFQVYPNPATNSFRLSGITSEFAIIRLFDSTGRLVISSTLQNDSEINIESLLPGLYQLQVINANQLVYSNQIVKL